MRLFAGDDRSGTRARGVPYRYAATATPSPNEFIELLAYSAYLDILDVSQAKTRFFKRDSTKADSLTIHPHKEREFWLWVASWAIFVQRPSDLGYDDTGYDLPALDVRWHELPTDHPTPATSVTGRPACSGRRPRRRRGTSRERAGAWRHASRRPRRSSGRPASTS